MTVETQVTDVTATGNDVAFVFSYSPLVIFKASELVVTRVIIATGVETLLVEGTGPSKYSVSPTSFSAVGATGSITYPADSVTALPATEKLVMKRVLVIEQQTKLQNQGAYFPKVLETALDKITMRILQLQELIDRAVKLPIGFTGTIGEADTPVASGFLRRNAADTGYEHITSVSTTAASASDATPQGVALLTAAPGAIGNFSRADHAHLVAPYIKVSADVHNALNFT